MGWGWRLQELLRCGLIIDIMGTMVVEAESPFPLGITTDSAAITSGTAGVTVAIEVAIEVALVADTADMDTVADMHPFMGTLRSTRSIRFTQPRFITADVTVTEQQPFPEAVL